MSYQFPFGVTGAAPNEGDVPTWDGEKWVAEPGAAVDTWEGVLEAGNTTGGFAPTISDGDSLDFLGSGFIQADDTLEVIVENSLTLTVNIGGILLDTATALFTASQGTARIGFVPNNSGNQLQIWGASAISGNNSGGNIEILGGEPFGSGVGGGLHISSGGATGTPGSINITIGAGTTPAIWIDGAHGEIDYPININTGGLSFWDGTPAIKPVVTDSTDLLVALDAMGLVTYTP